ncbi:SPRY domain-containing protein [Endozoicomonas acroporae]|uniref:SPRY domain-containing protein n=1 Tax=Endozoicomonas acroporae TaxID=1701104 RepID=UPI0013CFE69D|nr:SPRY domain-containing protein [Endozoicomonas acroporae]
MERNKYTCVSICTTWDPDKSSHNVRIIDGVPSKLYCEPALLSTELAMSDTGFSKGLHILDVKWSTEMRGSHAVIGVALAEAPKHANFYTNLLGSTESSWGWDINNNKLIHNGQTIGNYPKDKVDGVFEVPKKISCIIDMITGTIGFKTNGEYLGDAFSGLKHKTVFLAVSAVREGAKISVAYNKGCNNTPLSLQDLSKLTLRDRVKFAEQIDDLPTSPGLKRLIADKSITDLESIDENMALRRFIWISGCLPQGWRSGKSSL